MRRPLLTIGLLIVAFFVFMTLLSPKGPSGSEALLPEGPAPPMTIKTPSGETRSLADWKGKVVLVKFWATWCGPCAMSTPHVEKLYEKHKAEGFEVLGVALENDKGEQIPGYVRQMGITYTVGMADPSDQVRAWIGPQTGIPAVFLIDRKGRVRWSQSGYAPSLEHKLDEAVEAVLRE
jgi:thiol-disulfide isomerase/thioredoxin